MTIFTLLENIVERCTQEKKKTLFSISQGRQHELIVLYEKFSLKASCLKRENFKLPYLIKSHYEEYLIVTTAQRRWRLDLLEIDRPNHDSKQYQLNLYRKSLVKTFGLLNVVLYLLGIHEKLDLLVHFLRYVKFHLPP